MKQRTPLQVLLGAILTLGLTMSARAALVTVRSMETWDRVNNPHAADSVTTSGSGPDVDPYTDTRGPMVSCTSSPR